MATEATKATDREEEREERRGIERGYEKSCSALSSLSSFRLFRSNGTEHWRAKDNGSRRHTEEREEREKSEESEERE